MPYLRMKDDSPLTEYHGEFDCLPGDKSPDLSIDEAVKLVKRLPKVFEPVDFDIEAHEDQQAEELENKNLVTLRLTYNPVFEEYHSATGIDFDKTGDEKQLPFDEAKKLIERFPTAFEVVAGKEFQAEDSKVEAENKTTKEETEIASEPTVEAEDNSSKDASAITQQILDLVKGVPHSFEELEKKLDIPFNQLRGIVISLSKNKQIIKGKNEKWAIAI